ncbi:MAG: pallilysin-related adhesin [Treponema sp.]
MIKKLFYILCILAVPAIIGLLVYQRIVYRNALQNPQAAQTIIPAAPSLQDDEYASSEYFNTSGAQSFITLLSDEVLADELETDINGDNKEDKIVAVKKLSDQFIYLLIFLYNPETQTFNRTAELKTGVTQVKTVTFYTMSVREYAYPLIVQRGYNSDNMQVFSIYAVNIGNDTAVSAVPLINVQADGQITLKMDGDSSANMLSDCTVHTYHSDVSTPNTLNQIEKVYTWNDKKYTFEQTKESTIPGKKVESQFLKKLQTGSVDTFTEFLEGLWYQPTARENQNRSIFFNGTENEIIFSVNNIQEIFTVDSISPRRYGIYFSTKNTSISSIHRRIDIELTGVDEITVRVIEDVARLKIGASSNWDGMYRKISNNIRTVQKTTVLEDTKKTLSGNDKIWVSTEGYTLKLSDTMYHFIQDGTDDSGWYTILHIKNKIILQCKSKDKKERFFTVVFDDGTTDKKKKKLILTEVSVTLNDLILTGTHPLVFE